MKDIRNSKGKLVCRLDSEKLVIEIFSKGILTTIQIVPGKDPLVLNSTT